MSAPAPAWPISPSSSSRPVACARQRRNGLEYLVSLGGASADRPRGPGIGPCRPRHSVLLCRRSAPSAARRRSSARVAAFMPLALPFLSSFLLFLPASLLSLLSLRLSPFLLLLPLFLPPP